MATIQDLIDALGSGESSSAELQRELGVSQSTISRLLEDAGERVLRLGRARATRYVATREVFGGGYVQPLYRMGEDGSVSEIARLRSGRDRRWFVEALVDERWLGGLSGDGVYDDLPWFLDDLRPSGFLGREIGRRMAQQLGLPLRPLDWPAQQLGLFLREAGEIMHGDLLVGPGSAARALRQRDETVLLPESEYPMLAELAVAGEAPGSSAGGEQPKFTAWRRETGAVIVKFSPVGDDPVARRWRDLLVAEHRALQLLRSHGYAAAETRLVEGGGRLFLESRRFDRSTAHGRRPMFTLEAVDAEFSGAGSSWTDAALALQAAGLLSDDDTAHIAALHRFGQLIGNTDMHFGNLALAPTVSGFRLLPIYDMLPMALAPRVSELPPPRISPPPPATNLPISDPSAISEISRAYWHDISTDPLCSPDFQRIAASTISA